MKVQLIGSTNGIEDLDGALKFCQDSGRVCYSDKKFDEIKSEDYKLKFVDGLIKRGHHSVFEHFNLNLYIEGIPKILAMVLNNEKQCATSEKSARFTQMENIVPTQKELYDKWMGLLKPRIHAIYPDSVQGKDRDDAVRKLAQENARYMTSVFTPTKMVHTLNLRQLNFIQGEFERLTPKYSESDDLFKQMLALSMHDFLDETREGRVWKLDNQTGRSLSFFRQESDDEFKPFFGEVYSTNYLMSFAGLAQAHRHRTINYSIGDTFSRVSDEFFIPEIVLENNLESEWLEDLNEIAERDFPQAQLIEVYETGTRKDFKSKMSLRLCGHAQHEIMKNVLNVAETYRSQDPDFNQDIVSRCKQGYPCEGGCVWGGERVLERIV